MPEVVKPYLVYVKKCWIVCPYSHRKRSIDELLTVCFIELETPLEHFIIMTRFL
jgi:hypothetical protein